MEDKASGEFVSGLATGKAPNSKPASGCNFATVEARNLFPIHQPLLEGVLTERSVMGSCRKYRGTNLHLFAGEKRIASQAQTSMRIPPLWTSSKPLRYSETHQLGPNRRVLAKLTSVT